MFKDPYGPTKLEFPFFGESAADRFDNLVLRANGNDAWPYAGGSALREGHLAIARATRHDGTAYQICTFTSMEPYWGLYNLVERPDAAFSLYLSRR